MSDARQAIAAAIEDGAETYAPDELHQAQALLDDAENYLKQGISSGYWQAKQSAVSAKEIAFNALLKSRTAREREAAVD